ncbi:MAG: TauD/TfdA family dioxygenase, partial [Pseudomonadales bacterium]|nr:TauD/TfdA family dioxygenase [Pseudomonadales bacterium]
MVDYQSIDVAMITPKLGAEIGGVDLANLDATQVSEIKTAFREHLVLVFREQTMTREQHKGFARLWGDLQTHPAKTNLGRPGDPEIFDINITPKTKVANGEAWHTDLSCEPIPPLASALYITETPASGGGDTLFANMYEAYTSLSDQVKELL